MKSQTIRIVAAVVDTRQLTMYKEDGTTIVINQGDTRLRPIVDAAAPQLVQHGYADVVVPPAESNSYADYEKESGGVVKFFRVAKDKLKSLFSEEARKAAEQAARDAAKPVVNMSIGNVPKPDESVPVPVKVVEAINKVSLNMPEEFSAAVVQAEADLERDTLIGRPEHEEDNGLEPEAADLAPVVPMDNQEEQFEPVPEPAVQTKVIHTMSAINEIMAHAVPATAPDFHEEDVAKQGNVVEENGYTNNQRNEEDATHTIIAVVDNKIIPGMEKIKTQFGRAAKMGSTTGVNNFLQRLSSVIEQRSHSVEDLLRFMERADLPIAEDGSILIYKVLRRKNNHYVDCHTGNVPQYVGAYVCMDESLVDRNRNNECSNGLHVARRGYIRNFSGDVCVLAKLAPEDVIAVPSYDANKMRVCGYHIIAELSSEMYGLLKQNRPITDIEKGSKLLSAAIVGNHIRKTHEVRITGQKGAGVITTVLQPSAPVAIPAAAPVKAPTPVVKALDNPSEETKVEPTDPKEVVKVVEQQLSRKDQAKVLYDAWQHAKGNVEEAEALGSLVSFKKSAKVGWEKLGIPDPTAGTTTATKPAAKAKGKPAPTVKPKLSRKAKKKQKVADKKPSPLKNRKTPAPPFPAPVVSAAKVKASPQVMQVELDGEDRRGLVYQTDDAAASNKPALTKREVNGVELGEGSYRERIQKLLAIGLTSVGVAQAVLKLKQQSKKSWTTLGVSDEQVAEIIKLAQEK